MSFVIDDFFGAWDRFLRLLRKVSCTLKLTSVTLCSSSPPNPLPKTLVSAVHLSLDSGLFNAATVKKSPGGSLKLPIVSLPPWLAL